MKNNVWYENLKKSKLTPPKWVFGTIWTILYFTMVLYLFFILNNKECINGCPSVNFFIIQLIFNLSWTTLFFKFKLIKVALVDLLLTVGFTIMTFITSLHINQSISFILIPYILWLTLATYLNAYIVINN